MEKGKTHPTGDGDCLEQHEPENREHGQRRGGVFAVGEFKIEARIPSTYYSWLYHWESVCVSSGSFAWVDLLITFVICWRPPFSAPETLMQRPSNYPSPPHPTRRRLD